MQPAGCDVPPNLAADNIVGLDLDHFHPNIEDRARFLTGNSTRRSGIFRKTQGRQAATGPLHRRPAEGVPTPVTSAIAAGSITGQSEPISAALAPGLRTCGRQQYRLSPPRLQPTPTLPWRHSLLLGSTPRFTVLLSRPPRGAWLWPRDLGGKKLTEAPEKERLPPPGLPFLTLAGLSFTPQNEHNSFLINMRGSELPRPCYTQLAVPSWPQPDLVAATPPAPPIFTKVTERSQPCPLFSTPICKPRSPLPPSDCPASGRQPTFTSRTPEKVRQGGALWARPVVPTCRGRPAGRPAPLS